MAHEKLVMSAFWLANQVIRFHKSAKSSQLR